MENHKIKAVSYCRVSGNDKAKTDGLNLQGQLNMCREYALNKGYQLVAELAEDERGASGYKTDLPQLNRLLEMARLGQINVVVVRELDRLSRELGKQLAIEKELKRYEVRLECVLAEYSDTPEGTLSKHIRAVFSEYERELITTRMNRGRYLKVKNGSVLCSGKPPYGYRLVKEGLQLRLEINESEANTVRQIYNWYTQDQLSIYALATKLTELKIPTSSDLGRGRNKLRGYGVWSTSAVRYILTSKAYIGIWQYNKTFNVNGKRKRNTTENQIPVQVPAIISQDLFELAQTQKQANSINNRRNRKHDYLLSGRLTCQCGKKMSGKCFKQKTHDLLYYNCPDKSKSPDRVFICKMPLFRADSVDQATWNQVKKWLQDSEAFKQAMNDYHSEREDKTESLNNELVKNEGLLRNYQNQYDRLLDLCINGVISKEVFIERKKGIEETIKELEEKQTYLKDQLNEAIFSPEKKKYLENLALKISEGIMRAENSFTAKQEIIKLLNVKVKLSLNEEDQQVITLSSIVGNQSQIRGNIKS